MLSLYIATNVVIYGSQRVTGHLTLAFMNPKPTDKLELDSVDLQEVYSTVDSVEYWADANVTVAVLDDPDGIIRNMHRHLAEQGFTYDQEFIPHITLGQGNVVNENSDLINHEVYFNETYIRIKDF